MTVKEIYDACGGGYEEMLAKFRNDNIISTFLKMFLKDESFKQLKVKLDLNDAEGAFGAAHNLKGVVLNLNFAGLIPSVLAITETLRGGDISTAKEQFPEVEEAYNAVKTALGNL